ncbi:hypothetical protein [Micromonospora sp. KLBMP9576]|uniref:hypothetical protein n=1 Tax=Micromonospora sp. KLBMP9576 TaxID=3424769 RepID=UPI003D90BE43
MNISVVTTEVRGGTPAPRRVQVEGIDEIGIEVEARQTRNGEHYLSTVLFESTGECRIFLASKVTTA